MKANLTVPAALLLATALNISTAQANSLEHSGQSLEHSAQAIAHASAAGVQIVSGVVAVPLMAAGELGELSGQAGRDMWEFANEPLPVTDKVITAGPSPAEAMSGDGAGR